MSFGNVIEGLGDIVAWITDTAQRFESIFSDIDFTLLYNYFPNDIQAVVTSVIVVFLFLALFGILKRVLFFLG